MVMPRSKENNNQDIGSFLTLVKKKYREEGIKPLSRAMVEASEEWARLKKTKSKKGL